MIWRFLSRESAGYGSITTVYELVDDIDIHPGRRILLLLKLTLVQHNQFVSLAKYPLDFINAERASRCIILNIL